MARLSAETGYKEAIERLCGCGAEPASARRAIRIANKRWTDLQGCEAALREHVASHGCEAVDTGSSAWMHAPQADGRYGAERMPVRKRRK